VGREQTGGWNSGEFAVSVPLGKPDENDRFGTDLATYLPRYAGKGRFHLPGGGGSAPSVGMIDPFASKDKRNSSLPTIMTNQEKLEMIGRC